MRETRIASKICPNLLCCGEIYKECRDDHGKRRTCRRKPMSSSAAPASPASRWRSRCARGWAIRFAVTVVDPALAHAQSKDPRASAIAAAARRLFETIGVWDAVAADAQPILDMVVTDSKLEDAVRPAFLTFAGEVEEGEPFAHMIENRHRSMRW